MISKQPSPYEDIIHLPHPVSRRHPPMPLLNRAAQFSPFAALTGHEDAIRETQRLTQAFVELEEDQRELLDRKLKLLSESLEEQPEIEVTCFRPDEKKAGGTYVTFQGRLKKIDGYSRRIYFTDGTDVPIDHLLRLESCSLGDAEE